MLAVPSVANLAAFTGRAESSFTGFATQALTQATLLFSVVTRLTDFPTGTDPDTRQLAINAILEMADRIYLEQPYAAAKSTPYSSETIGSYSYAKGSTAAKAKDRQPTGLLWWDLAVDELSLPERSIVASGSIAVDHTAVYCDADGNRYVLGPDQTDTGPDWLGADVNAELNPRPALG